MLICGQFIAKDLTLRSNFYLQDFWWLLKNSLSPLRGLWGQQVIFKVAEAKVWISSSFNRFLFRNFVVLDFKVVWPRQPQRPQKQHTQTFWKWPQINANFPKINERYESWVEVALKPNVVRREKWDWNFAFK